jgi:23S rRNA A2030 N6-methylase RlmJ
MQAANLDALVLVHPDFETPTEEYLENVSTLVQEYRKAGKPIFVIDDHKVNDPEMRRIV